MSKDRVVEFLNASTGRRPAHRASEDGFTEAHRRGGGSGICRVAEPIRGPCGRARPARCGSERVFTRARDTDGHWPGEGASAQGAGPQRVGSQVQLKIAAALSEAHETDRGVAALALPQGGVHGGFPGGPGGFAGRRCQRGLSPGTISRLKDHWREDHAQWLGRDLSQKRYVYFWADGVYFNIRGDEARQCILVIVGVDVHGIKEFVAIEDGYRESEQSWLEVLSSCKQRGLEIGPELAVGDGALGFWKALSKVYGKTRHQRCWVHKTANVLNKLPRATQAKAKSALHQIWMAATREEACRAFDEFLGTYRDKYPKATECLEKDRNELLAFYDFPAAHWQHIRTTNPIESTFATVRLRTRKTRGCVSRQTILALVFQLGQSAQKRWRRLRGFKHLAEVIKGVKFENGVRADTVNCRAAA